MTLCLPATACIGTVKAPAPPRATWTDRPGEGVALDRLALAVVDLPPDVRDGRPVQPSASLDGWTELPDRPIPTFETKAPVRPRATFFDRAPRNLKLLDAAGRAMPYASSGLRRWWRYSDGRIQVQLPGGAADLAGLKLSSDVAASREARLNPSFSGITDPEAFVRARLHLDAVTREGLLLPAPATIGVDVDLPEAAELHFTPILLPPEIADLPPSDGATIQIEVRTPDGRTALDPIPLKKIGVAPEVHLDLSRWAGQRVRLDVRTDPGVSSRFDYVFLADPIVASRTRRPRRAVVVFIDTLRPDALPTYGAERDTAPWIHSHAERGVVFERAFSPAPWTLPSYRALWTGRRPLAFGSGPDLGQVLRARGVATGLIGANLYLGDTFGGARGFGYHRVEHLASAEPQVGRALDWLDAHRDRDALLVLHLMDPHLPYTEPEPFRSRFAGEAPSGWPHGDEFLRSMVSKASEAERTWIRDRYDNNIAYVDHELARLDHALTEDDLLIVLSDHGEEFWDHGGFEHGHTLHEEVVRVPLIVRGPSISPRRHAGTVSLMDVAPTLAGWWGAELPEADGRDLSDWLRSDVGAPTPADVPLGHPLYGFERWGVTDGARTYETHAGTELVWDLAGGASAAPQADTLLDWRGRLGSSHEHTVVRAVRVAIRTRGRHALEDDLVLTATSGQAMQAWMGEDATSPIRPELRTTDQEAVWRLPKRWRGSREIYLTTPAAEVALQAKLGRLELGPLTLPESPFPGTSTYLDQPIGDGVRLTVTRSTTVLPKPTDAPTSAYNAELRAMLERAGYLTP